jgi:2,4-dienoyl-CoA reductase-like NADH-dependent reductase (Old Yellow Enzyme family)
MKELREKWRLATLRAADAGFDVLEVHCAHGYLLHEFLSPLSNKREDAYGGDRAGRMRFPLEIIETVRAAWPQDRPLSVRVSSVDGVEGGVEITDSVAFAREAKARGADLIDCSSGGLLGSATAARIPRGYGFQVPFAETIRREAEIATMAVGLILHPQQADDVVAQGQADLVGIGREALFDPNWPLHARLALGEQDGEVFGAWPKQYGWWLERREPGLRKLDGPELPYRKGQAR